MGFKKLNEAVYNQFNEKIASTLVFTFGSLKSRCRIKI
jgi:hypothetical protein